MDTSVALGRASIRFPALWLLAGVVFSGCGGRGTVNAPISASVLPAALPPATSSPAATATKTVPVTLTFQLPSPAPATAGAARKALGRMRALQFISPSNTQLTITVTPLGGAPTVFGPTACTNTACTVSFSAAPGATKLNFSFTNGGTVLSTFDTTTVIQPATATTLAFSANPVVASCVLQLASPAVNAGTGADDLLTLAAKDAAGNTIIGTDGYVDSAGNPVAFFFNVTNVQAGGSGTVTLTGAPRIISPSQSLTNAHYDGNWLESATITAVSTSSFIASPAPVTISVTPQIVQSTLTTTTGSVPYGITAGPDGNIWFTEWKGNKIGRLDRNKLVTEFPLPGNVGGPTSIVTGPDGALWFTEYDSVAFDSDDGNQIGRITTGGSITELTTPTAGSGPSHITIGPDGALWFTENSMNKLGRISSRNTISEYAVPGFTAPWYITVGPDNNLWFGDGSGQKIGKMDIVGRATTYGTPSTPNSWVDGIVTGPDGNIWFTEEKKNRIGKSTLTGNIVEYVLPTLNSVPTGLIVGPDGYLWFTENGRDRLVRMDLNGNVVGEYAVPNGSDLSNLTVGPDGNIWFTEPSHDKIDKFVY